MKKIFCIISTVLLFPLISCYQNKSFPDYKRVSITEVNFLLDSIKKSIEGVITIYTDSIAKSVELTYSPEKIIAGLDSSQFGNVIESIEKKDIDGYLYYFERRPYRDILDYTPYAVCMAVSTVDADVYLSVYSSLSSINRSKRENVKPIDNDMSLDELTENQRKLALYYLIKSYQLGGSTATLLLSFYFRDGLYYLPKDIPVAYKLESVFLKNMEIEYWPGTDIKIE